jgi:pilus assembly protein CpaC
MSCSEWIEGSVVYQRHVAVDGDQAKRSNMDTFSPVAAPSSRIRNLALISAASLVALSLSLTLPQGNAATEVKVPVMPTPVVKAPVPSGPMYGALMTDQAVTLEASADDHVSPAALIDVVAPTGTTAIQTVPASVVVPQMYPSTDFKPFASPTTAPSTPAPVASRVQQRPPTPVAKPAAVQWTPGTQAKLVTTGLDAGGGLTLSVNRTTELKATAPVKRVSVAQPEIADIQPFADNLLLVTAKKAGSTQVILWDENNQSQSIDVNVEIPLEQLKDLISKLAPGSNVELSIANDTIVLRGQAPNLTVAKQIGDVAGAYGKTQNFIQVAGGQTVAVQVQFAEVSRSVTNSLGVNWGFSDGTAVFGSSPGGNGPLGFNVNGDGYIDGLSLSPLPGVADIFGRIVSGQSVFGFFIKALRENNLLRVLQEPNLTTTSGEPASFLAGGQVAVPVPSDNGTIGIEYKEFGIRLLLTPIVLGNGKIRLIMEAESSDLDYSNGTTIQSARVPGLRTRRVQSSVEIGEGQTMSVAGLLDDSVIATRQSVPGVGDLPVLGQLFRSTRYQRKETELVILITPRLSGPMNPDQVTALPGANWRHPNELEQFAFGDLGGNAEADATRDAFKKPSERGLKPEDRAPRTTGNPLAAGDLPTDGPVIENAAVPVEPPMFIGEHGFAPAVTKKESAIPTSDTASVRD